MTVSVPNTFIDGPGNTAFAADVNENFQTLVDAFNNDFMPKAGGAFTAIPTVPASSPTTDNQVTRKKYVDDLVAGVDVTPPDGSVTAAKLASDAVTTVKILDGNVTAAKLAADSVTASKIVDGTITGAKIGNNEVTYLQLANDSVITSTIHDGSITPEKMAATAGSSITCTAKRNSTTLASTTNYASYAQYGKWVKGYLMLTLNATAAGAGDFHVYTNLPAPLHAGAVCGTGIYLNQGTAFYQLGVLVNSDNFTFLRDNEGALFGNAFTVANTDYIKIEFEYEAA